MELTNLAPIVKSLKSPGNQAAAEISQLLGFLLFPFVRTYVILLVVLPTIIKNSSDPPLAQHPKFPTAGDPV